MDKKIKILGIAPYEGLAALMRQYEEQRQDIKLTAMFGNMEKGVSIAQEYFMEYDLIISRANTAAMISNAVPIPVTDIKIDYYDVLRCIKMAEQTHTRFIPLLTSRRLYAICSKPRLTFSLSVLRQKPLCSWIS